MLPQSPPFSISNANVPHSLVQAHAVHPAPRLPRPVTTRVIVSSSPTRLSIESPARKAAAENLCGKTAVGLCVATGSCM
jgi:hypothetical protein